MENSKEPRIKVHYSDGAMSLDMTLGLNYDHKAIIQNIGLRMYYYFPPDARLDSAYYEQPILESGEVVSVQKVDITDEVNEYMHGGERFPQET